MSLFTLEPGGLEIRLPYDGYNRALHVPLTASRQWRESSPSFARKLTPITFQSLLCVMYFMMSNGVLPHATDDTWKARLLSFSLYWRRPELVLVRSLLGKSCRTSRLTSLPPIIGRPLPGWQRARCGRSASSFATTKLDYRR